MTSKRSAVILLGLCSIFILVSGFRPLSIGKVYHTKLITNRIINKAEYVIKTDLCSISREQDEPYPQIDINVREYVAPQQPNFEYLLKTIGGQGLLCGCWVLWGKAGGFDPMSMFDLSIDNASMMMAAMAAALAFGFRQAVDYLPTKPFHDIALETRVYVMNMIGTFTSPVKAAVIASLVSGFAGLSEEFLFRGILLTMLEGFIGVEAAIIFSSLCYGLVHQTTVKYGQNAILETFVGIIFGYAYVASGHNLAVPIAGHIVYNFATILVTWWLSTNQFHAKISQLHVLPEKDLYYGTLAKAVFDTIDHDHDGAIDIRDLERGMRYFGIHSLGRQQEKPGEVFNQLDSNHDGRVTLSEFASLLQDGVYEIPAQK